MKKQINPTINAHFIRSACYVLLLVAVCVIPLALAQRNTTKRNRTTGKTWPAMAATGKAAATAPHTTVPSSGAARVLDPAQARAVRAAAMASRAAAAAYPHARAGLAGMGAHRLNGTTGTGACVDVNGDFETGDLPPWTDTGDTSFTGVDGNPHSGTFALFSGPSTGDGFIDQILPTVDGQAYDVSFWLENDDDSGNNRFGASLGGIVLVPEATQSAFGYTQFTFTNVVPGANADLQFIFFNQPSFFYLDDVCVTPSGGGGTPTPSPTATPTCIPGGNQWSEVAAYPFAARGPFVVSDGTFYYTGGGYDGFDVHTETFRYDPVANTYTPLASAPDPFFLSQAVIFNNKIYSIGGFNLGGQSSNTRIYDIATDTWTTGAPIPEPLGLSDAATGLDSVGGKIYVACGLVGGSTASNTLHIYDIATDTWTTGAQAPDALYLPGFGVINGKFYVASGNNGVNEVFDLQIYDIATDTWSTGAPIPTPVTGAGSAVFNGKLYVFGGTAPFPVTTTITQIYDPATDSWSSGPSMVAGKLWFYGGPLDDTTIFAPGGDDSTIFPTNDAQALAGGGGGASPTPTPSGTPSCAPGPWQEQAPMPLDLYGAAGASDGTFFYAAGGYSFSQIPGTVAVFNRYDPAANTWTPLPDMPQSAAMPVAVYYPPTNKIYVFGGEDGDLGTNYNITRIYDVASNSWTTGANMPDVRSFAAGGYVPATGMIYIVAGYNTGDVTSSQNTTWQYDPALDTWTDLTGTDPYPHAAGGFAYGVINDKLYVSGGRDAALNIINDTYEFDPTASAGSRYTQKADQPGTFQNNVPGSAAAQGKLWVYGGGNPFTAGPETDAGITAPTKARVVAKPSSPLAFVKKLFGFGPRTPDTAGDGRFYDPATDTWSDSPDMNEIRAFVPSGAIGDSLIIAAGGYNGAGTVASVETENVCAGGGVTPTPTPSASPTCPPGSPNGAAGPWTAGTAYPTTIVRYGFAQTSTHLYVFGGVDNGAITPAVNRMDLATGTWEPRAAMPFSSEGPTCALDEAAGLVYCAEGADGAGGGNQFASYNIATDSWTPLAPDPFVLDHFGSVSGVFNGKVFVIGGTQGFSNANWVYDIASNSWSLGTAAPTTPFEFPGYHQVGQFLYVVGGYDGSFNNVNTTLRLDMSSAPGVWETGPTFTPQLADFGLAYDPGTNTLYSLGGDLGNDGNPFNSTAQVNELDVSAWPGGTWNPSPPDLPAPPRQAAQAGFFGNGDIWAVGGINGATFQFLNEVWHRNNGGGVVCPSPTPTVSPTATATVTPASPTPTATATATITPPPSATPTASATATTPPGSPTPSPTRPPPTPRPRPTPYPRPTPP